MPDGDPWKKATDVATNVEYYQEGDITQKEVLPMKDGEYHKKTTGYFGQELSNP